VNFYSFLSSRLGLGEAARNTARLLARRGYSFASADIEADAGLTHEELDPSWNAVEDTSGLRFGVNFFYMNPPELTGMITHWPVGSIEFHETVNAGVATWELPLLPRSWVPVCESLDAVLAPTPFAASSIERACPDARVMVLHQAVYVPEHVDRSPRRWGIGEGVTAFVCMADVLSDFERKNPWGAAAAFQEAFPDRSDVILFIKAGNTSSPKADPAQVERLRELERDTRIRVIRESLSREDLWSLYASADAYISLHRSEGHGLGLLEAMAVGTPVVGTGWSGNLDFMTEENSFLVPYEIVPVGRTSNVLYGENREGQTWAEPSIPGAAAILRRIVEHPELTSAIGHKALEGAHAAWRRHRDSPVFDDLLALFEGGVTGSREHRRGAARLVAMNRSLETGRERAVRWMRAAGLKPARPPAEVTAAPAFRLLDSAHRSRLVRP